MAVISTRDDIVKLRERCLEKVAFYTALVSVCDLWIRFYDRLCVGIVTQKEDPGAGS